jgi:ribonuclease D
MEPIRTTQELATACQRLVQSDFVAIDTEFMRDQTYWPKVCLIQAATEEASFIIDPLAPGIELKPFFELLTAPKVLKVFHAARQDIEIFHHLARIIPHPFFDTQIAAMVCGFGEAVSYETLVRKTLNAQIDKSSRFTDWSRRPLSEKQLSYALADVTHLCKVYRSLSKELEETGRVEWVEEEMSYLTTKEIYELRPEDAWKRLRTRTTSKKFLSVLMEVAAWRERDAQTRDLPRGRILKDEAVVEIAAQQPKSLAELEALRAVPRGFANSRSGPALVEAVQRGLARPLSEVPTPERVEPVADGAGALIDLLKVLLKARCEQHGVAPKLVASSEDLERIASDEEPDIPAMHGWRRDVFGEAAIELKRGRLALSAQHGRIVLVPQSETGRHHNQ